MHVHVCVYLLRDTNAAASFFYEQSIFSAVVCDQIQVCSLFVIILLQLLYFMLCDYKFCFVVLFFCRYVGNTKILPYSGIQIFQRKMHPISKIHLRRGAVAIHILTQNFCLLFCIFVLCCIPMTSFKIKPASPL